MSKKNFNDTVGLFHDERIESLFSESKAYSLFDFLAVTIDFQDNSIDFLYAGNVVVLSVMWTGGIKTPTIASFVRNAEALPPTKKILLSGLAMILLREIRTSESAGEAYFEFHRLKERKLNNEKN
jgi:hypothetical protein